MPERDVVTVRILDAELTKAMRGVVDRVVDSCAPLLNFSVDDINVVNPDVAFHIMSTICQ